MQRLGEMKGRSRGDRGEIEGGAAGEGEVQRLQRDLAAPARRARAAADLRGGVARRLADQHLARVRARVRVRVRARVRVRVRARVRVRVSLADQHRLGRPEAHGEGLPLRGLRGSGLVTWLGLGLGLG